MHPVLFQIGPITIYTYGVFVAMGFLLGLSTAMREARLAGEDPQQVVDMALYILLGAIIGSRVLYVLVSWGEFAPNPLQIFMIWKGGLVFYGGLAMAVLVIIWYTRRNHMSLLKTLDICAMNRIFFTAGFFTRSHCFSLMIFTQCVEYRSPMIRH